MYLHWTNGCLDMDERKHTLKDFNLSLYVNIHQRAEEFPKYIDPLDDEHCRVY